MAIDPFAVVNKNLETQIIKLTWRLQVGILKRNLLNSAPGLLTTPIKLCLIGSLGQIYNRKNKQWLGLTRQLRGFSNGSKIK